MVASEIVDYFVDFLIVTIVFSPLYILLGNNALKYHYVKNQISPEALEIFLRRLALPLRFIYSRTINNEKFEEIPESYLAFRRLLHSILPTLFILAALIGLARLSASDSQLILIYILYLIVDFFLLFFAWRFGQKLNIIQASLNTPSKI